MDLARLDTRASDSCVVVRVQGEVDASNASAIGDEIAAEAVSCTAGLVVDLTDTEYLDSAGIRMLFSLNSRLDLSGRRVCLVASAVADPKGPRPRGGAAGDSAGRDGG